MLILFLFYTEGHCELILFSARGQIEEEKMKIRPMSFCEFDEYQDFVEDMADKGVKPSKVSRKAAAWIMDKIYGVDVQNTNINPGKIMKIVTDTIEATLKLDEDEEKN